MKPAAFLLAGLVVLVGAPHQAGAAATCPPSNSHVWFLGVVYDSAQRDDFKLDVDNFEFYLSKLRNVYCIPASQAKILAFENSFTRNGVTYDAATETAVKSQLATMGTAASAHTDSIFFFFLSSHGIFYATSLACPGGGVRAPGSLSALKSGGGNDGNFLDCELGASLTNNFDPDVKMFVAVDCSFCGGFSDSLTAVSGTLEDDSLPRSSGVPAPNRVVVTGCAITTECFGSDGGGVSYKHLKWSLQQPVSVCDGFTAPGFPAIQGFNVPVDNSAFNPADGNCTSSEWFFSAVQHVYSTRDVIGIQQQFRIKYGFASLADDILIQ